MLASTAGSTAALAKTWHSAMSLSPWAQHEQTADTVAVCQPSPRLCRVVTLLLSLSPDCSFTCHYRCRALVQLDCGGPPGAGDEDDGNEQVLEKDTNVVGPVPVCEGELAHGVANWGLRWAGAG